MGGRALVFLFAGVATVVACSAFEGSDPATPNDAGGSDAGTIPGDGGDDPAEPVAPPTDGGRGPVQRVCAPGSTFGTPVQVSFKGETTGRAFVVPRLTDDELTIYFGEQSANPYRILRSFRASKNDPFEPPTEATELVSSLMTGGGFAGVLHPWIDSRATSVYYTRIITNNVTKEYYGEIWAVVRLSNNEWSEPGKVRFDLDNGHSTPFLTDDSLTTMYFSRASKALAAAQDTDIYVTTRAKAGDPFADPVKVDTVATVGVREQMPVLSADGLELFLQRGAASASKPIWLSVRPDKMAAFAPPVPLDSSAMTVTQGPGWLSPDGCRLYYSEAQGSDADTLWMRERTPTDGGL